MSLEFNPRPASRFSLAALALVLVCTGCDDLPLTPLTEAQHRDVLADCPAEAFLLRGWTDNYSLGLNHLTDRLTLEGVNATVLNHLDWPAVAEAILDQMNRGKNKRPLILVGHSFGCDDSIRLAEFLRPHGVEFDLVVLLDATDPPLVPDNVIRCLHIWQPALYAVFSPELFPGNPVYAAPGNTRTELVNRLVSIENLGIEALQLNHFSIDSSQVIHDMIVDEIIGQCAPSR